MLVLDRDAGLSSVMFCLSMQPWAYFASSCCCPASCSGLARPRLPQRWPPLHKPVLKLLRQSVQTPPSSVRRPKSKHPFGLQGAELLSHKAPRIQETSMERPNAPGWNGRVWIPDVLVIAHLLQWQRAGTCRLHPQERPELFDTSGTAAEAQTAISRRRWPLWIGKSSSAPR